RYAELLPEGPARARASATAHAIAAVFGPMTLERFAAIVGPDVEFVDNRPLGLPSSRGRDAFRRLLGSLLDAVADIANPPGALLAVAPDAFLLLYTHFGTERPGGGAFERPFLLLALFDADGLVSHWEFFPLDREAEALARFDELVSRPGGPLPATSTAGLGTM